MVYNEIKGILPHFQVEGTYQSAEELHSGNINNTYHMIYAAPGGEAHYALQYINPYVFKEPRGVMRNIALVTGHLRKSLIQNGVDPARHVLELIPTCAGDILYEDERGGIWRCYRYITNATAYDRPQKDAHLFEAGRAFGEFQRLLCDFPAEALFASIPDFHNTKRRFYTFVQSVAADQAGRAERVEEEIEFFFDRRRMMGQIVRLLDHGEIPLRVTHNDTKINNVMIDDRTDKAICVIDLDTVMPGSSLYDYGDAIRFAASTAAEDEPDTGKIALDMEKFRLFTQGFLSEVDGFLTEGELSRLVLGVKVITCELAMRFLAVYLDGDVYFKVNSPDHNLIRARAQMKLLTDVESKEEELVRIIRQMRGL